MDGTQQQAPHGLIAVFPEHHPCLMQQQAPRPPFNAVGPSPPGAGRLHNPATPRFPLHGGAGTAALLDRRCPCPGTGNWLGLIFPSMPSMLAPLSPSQSPRTRILPILEHNPPDPGTSAVIDLPYRTVPPARRDAAYQGARLFLPLTDRKVEFGFTNPPFPHVSRTSASASSNFPATRFPSVSVPNFIHSSIPWIGPATERASPRHPSLDTLAAPHLSPETTLSADLRGRLGGLASRFKRELHTKSSHIWAHRRPRSPARAAVRKGSQPFSRERVTGQSGSRYTQCASR